MLIKFLKAHIHMNKMLQANWIAGIIAREWHVNRDTNLLEFCDK